MLLAFVIWSTITLCIANPLHKYPYVFLLDVGNEELEKTNTEQLRISIPGGSLAMKYPALGDGDPISHVRVSGIDFGTDLKVNIVEGGPGYKYVVLMFMGNPGVTYDAVVTLQTLQTFPGSTEINLVNNNKFVTTESLIANPFEVSEANSEDNDQGSINNSKDMTQYSKKSKEIMQSSSVFYNYAKGGMANGDENKEAENISAEVQDDDDDDSSDEDHEVKNEYSNSEEQQYSNDGKPDPYNQEDRKVSNEDEDENDEDESVQAKLYSEQNFEQFREVPRMEQYSYNVNFDNADNAKLDNTYDKYQDPKPHLVRGFRVYPQRFIFNKQYQFDPAYNKEDPVEFDQMYNDEEIKNDSRFKDVSNNIDSDYLVAEY